MRTNLQHWLGVEVHVAFLTDDEQHPLSVTLTDDQWRPLTVTFSEVPSTATPLQGHLCASLISWGKKLKGVLLTFVEKNGKQGKRVVMLIVII